MVSRGTERSAVTPLLLVVLVLTASLSIAVGRLGGAAVAAERAQAMADATALAAAVGGAPAAAAVAEANGAVLLEASVTGEDDRTWVVHLRAQGSGASAAATTPPAAMGD